MEGPPRPHDMSYPGKVLVTIALLALALAAWHLRHLFLLVFAGLLVATVLVALAGRVRRLTHLSHRLAVIVCVILACALLAALGWFVGGVLVAQAGELASRLPGALAAARAWLETSPVGPYVVQLWDDVRAHDVSWSRVAGAAGLTLGIAGDTLLVLLVGVFIAAEPQLYRQGLLRLLPTAHRRAVGDALDCCGGGLRGWLKGQALSMTFVGLATGVGLSLLGVPLALVLGIVAAMLDFVPFFGPIVSGGLAVLLSLSEGPQVAMQVAILVLAIQQVEGNLVVPLVQRHTVHLPPAVGVVSVVVAAGLFGLTGVLLATPLAVVAMLLVKALYVEAALEGAPARR
ncbi:AI-2E family transporter [Ramlibacter sp. USB13]|uniref:AI-2E family transporter n=1 Tax=Ramlibacter cellulosilyticus TaxID=2764187 RepID=A0A923MRT7_9BURK|nr:AI-2E family transporter [Ramlibacter cellulosilyticus]MBC5784043.1 AI-2E family transporter [Ramlibacter cellulosilyticus]